MTVLAGLPLLAACGAPSAPAAPTSPPAAPPGQSSAPTSAAAAKPAAPAATSAPTSAPAAPTSAPAAAAAKPSGSGVKMPTYAPITIAPPDLPGDDKVEPGYFAFPRDTSKTVTETPIKGGGEINVMTWNVTGPIAPLDSNTAWQEINTQLGAKINLVNNVSNSDYRTKLATVVAGGDLPDTIYIPATPGGQSAPFAQFPDFLDRSAADLTPYLSGDAVKEFPNLAAIPTRAWKSVTYKNKIYGVPVSFPLVPGTVLWVHQEMLDDNGQMRPKSTDEFKSILTALKKPDAGFFGIGASVQGADTTSGAFDLGMYQMYFGAPNNWKLDASGKLTRSFETDQYKAAVSFARDLVAAGLYHPDSPTFNQVSVRTNFVGRKYVFVNSGWLAAAIQYWGGAQSQTPPGKLDIVTPFGSDGGKGSFYTGTQLFGWSMLKKAPEARVKDLLRMFNFFAAPFGSEEYLLINYGVKGKDFNFDEQGNPVLTGAGKTNVNSLWTYIVQPPQVYYNATKPKDFASMMQSGAKAMIAVGVEDPAASFYSETHAAKGSIVNQGFLSAMGDIIAGRRPFTDYDGLVKEWQSGGGNQIRTEFEQAIAMSS
jgi:putative aldouronate transport system substrate-binding protein